MDLIIWTNFIKDLNDKRLTLPPGIDDIAISEKFNSKKPFPDFDYPWVMPDMNDEGNFIYPELPEEVFVSVKNVKNVAFDFYNFVDFYIVSEQLLNFIKKYGDDTENYQLSQAHIVDRNGKNVTEKNYFLLRPSVTDDDLISFDKEVILPDSYLDEDEVYYEEIKLKGNTSKKVLFVSMFSAYNTGIFFTSDLKSELQSTFNNPPIYTPIEWLEQAKSEMDIFE